MFSLRQGVQNEEQWAKVTNLGNTQDFKRGEKATHRRKDLRERHMEK